jgi:lipoate-protein ligase A
VGKSGNKMILIDNRNNHDPYINASTEEYIVRHFSPSSEDYLMLYINTPCVVVGKNQCIYKEVNIAYLREERPVVRRISGGGTVYHDEGNLCFAILSAHDDKKVNNYAYFNQPILDALHSAGIDAAFNKRNDIVWKEKKISGNAQFTNRKNIISHGTILVNADLGQLRYALKDNPFSIHTKAVSSVKSSVMNISDASDRFKAATELQQYLSEQLPITATHTFSDNEWQQITQMAQDKFTSQEWIWGRNPHSVITRDDELRIEVDSGKIEAITSKGDHILPELNGVYYGYKDIKAAVEKVTADIQEREKIMTFIF